MVRFHELDALRASAMLLGIVLHCIIFVTSDPQELWPVQEPWGKEVDAVSNPYAHLYLLVHGFRMPLFFLLSGFFTAMLWQRRGLRALIDHRLKRIALPLALGAVTVVPVCVLLWTTFEPETFGEFNLFHWPIAWLVSVVDLGFLDFGFYHLWFLWQLLLLLVIFAMLVRLGVQFTSRAWWVLVPLVALIMFFMEEELIGPDTSSGVNTDWRVLAFYSAFFLFGAFYYQRGIKAQRRWAVGVGLAIVVAYPGAVAFFLPGEIEPQTWRWAGTAVFQALYAWLMCFGMMGLFTWIAAKEREWVRYMSDSSYWLYLWHVPLVVIGQWALVDAAISPHLKLVLVFVAVIAILLATYHLGVRYTLIGTMLNGKRSRTPRSTPPPSSTPAVGTS